MLNIGRRVHCADMNEVSARTLRKYIFDFFLETTRAPLAEEMMPKFGWSRGEVLAHLQELQAAHHIFLLPGTERILMANPFSSLPTPFRVSAGRRQYFANCAWDAIALHVVLDQDVRISSFCHHCGAPLEFGLSKRTVSPEGRGVLVFLQTPVSKWYDNLLTTCSNTMMFFLSEPHLAEWKRAHPGFTGAELTIDKMIQAVTPISMGRATLEYQMPSRDQLMAHWESIGLEGTFWRF